MIYLFHLDINVFWGYLSVGVVSATLSKIIISYIDGLDFTLKMDASGSGAGGGGESGWGKHDVPTSAPVWGPYYAYEGDNVLGGSGKDYFHKYPLYFHLGSNKPHSEILAHTLEHNYQFGRRSLTKNMLSTSGQKFLADYLESSQPDLHKAYIENTKNPNAPAYNKVKITAKLLKDLRNLP